MQVRVFLLAKSQEIKKSSHPVPSGALAAAGDTWSNTPPVKDDAEAD